MRRIPLAAALAVGLVTASAPSSGQAGTKSWKSGKAEITSYQLEQARYGALHPGEAVLIFVREPFSRSKQVKLDRWDSAGADLVNVLKLNFTRRFNTGIYPYTTMLSTFTPDSGTEAPLKVTTSVQEWCGHVFTQLNRTDAGFDVAAFSYFESEGDQRAKLPETWLEDAIWTQIRLDPNRLPMGDIRIVPGTLFTRLFHRPLQPEQATATLVETVEPTGAGTDTPTSTYTIRYQSGSDRVLSVTFEQAAPHAIVRWEESGTDFSGQNLTTRAKRLKSIELDYWNHNQPADRALRNQLGLPENQ